MPTMASICSPVGLYARKCDGRRLHQRRYGRCAGRPDADAGGGDADSVDARRHGRDDLRQSQPLCRQWHQSVRLSGYMLENAMVAGFTSVGMDVVLVGPMPTPAVAMLTQSMRADMGVMISANHNPYADNGINLFACRAICSKMRWSPASPASVWTLCWSARCRRRR